MKLTFDYLSKLSKWADEHRIEPCVVKSHAMAKRFNREEKALSRLFGAAQIKGFRKHFWKKNDRFYYYIFYKGWMDQESVKSGYKNIKRVMDQRCPTKVVEYA